MVIVIWLVESDDSMRRGGGAAAAANGFGLWNASTQEERQKKTKFQRRGPPIVSSPFFLQPSRLWPVTSGVFLQPPLLLPEFQKVQEILALEDAI